MRNFYLRLKVKCLLLWFRIRYPSRSPQTSQSVFIYEKE